MFTGDGYLPGILALAYSLRVVGSRYPFFVMATRDISADSFAALDKLGVQYFLVEPIANPFFFRKPSLKDRLRGRKRKVEPRFLTTFTKLHIWELTQFDKLVYIDGDMLVCDNIDDLFDRPTWSAANAGGELAENRDWVDLCSGLMVVEPDKNLYVDMLNKIDKVHSNDGGDQGFLHKYFPEWPKRADLHVPHGYNMGVELFDAYVKELGYDWSRFASSETKKVKALHYWGNSKPWVIPMEKMNFQFAQKNPYYFESIMLWHRHYAALADEFGLHRNRVPF